MGEWISIEHWPDCRQWEKPGIVFELRNDEGLSLYAPCGILPATPFDWKTPPRVFRAVVEPAPTHSTPLPPPATR